MKTEVINTRVEPKLKRSAEAVLRTLGLSTSDAVTLFLHQIVLSEGLPFEVKIPGKIPNKITQRALKNVFAHKNVVHYKSLEDLKREFE